MPQNRNQFIDIFIGNLANAIVHTILEKSLINKEELINKYLNKYRNEIINSYEIAKRYREKINPINKTLPIRDVIYIKDKLRIKVIAELNLRISKGYQNINLDLINEEIDKVLRELGIEDKNY